MLPRHPSLRREILWRHNNQITSQDIFTKEEYIDQKLYTKTVKQQKE